MEPTTKKEKEESGKMHADPEKAKKMKKCYDYMTNLKSLLTREEYSQYLLYLKLLNTNYLKAKIIFYARVAFQIFFPKDIKAVLDNFQVRKALFSQSKYFFPKSDREEYTLAINELLSELEQSVHKHLEGLEKRIAKSSLKPEKKGIKLKAPVYLEFDKTQELQEVQEAQDTKMTSVVAVEKPVLIEEDKGKPEGDIICMICFEAYEKGKDFSKAKCGHVACSLCWTQWLGNCLECPMCKLRTRAKQLTKI